MMIAIKIIWQMIAILLSIAVLIIVLSTLITLILNIANGKDDEEQR